MGRWVARPGLRALALLACVMVALSSACGGCAFRSVTSSADLESANVVAQGRVVATTQLPGDRELTDTFQVDSLWKGSDFPKMVTFRLPTCEPGRDGVLILTKAQADMARATGHIDGDMRAYDTWSVLDFEPWSFRLTHDPRVGCVIGEVGGLVGGGGGAVGLLGGGLDDLGP